MIRFLDKTEFNIYPALFENCFGYKDLKSNPSVIMVNEHEKRVIAFLSGYYHNLDEFYLQYAGIIPEYRSKKLAKNMFDIGLNKLRVEKNINYVTYLIENTNKPALLTAVHCDFILNGFTITTDGKAMGRFIKDLRG